MSAPFIIQQPGIGQAASQGLAAIMQALQFKQQQALQQQQLAAQERERERARAMDLLATIIQQPGAETAPITQQVESTLGVTGFTRQLAQARRRAGTEAQRQYEEFITNLPVTDEVRTALRGDFVFAQQGVPAETRNAMFERLAGAEGLGPLDRARLQEITLRNRALIRELAQGEATPANQQRAATALGIPEQEFIPGMDYIGVLEQHLKEKSEDPHRLMFTGALQLAAQTDLAGRFIRTPAEAVQLAASTFRSIFPSSAQNIQFSGALEAQIGAMRDVTQALAGLQAEGELPSRPRELRALRTRLKAELRARYGPTVEDGLDQILDLAFRRLGQ